MQVNHAFFLQGDGMHNSAALLPELLEDGKRLLVYAGNADAMCNFMVCHRFSAAFDRLVALLHVSDFVSLIGEP